VAWANKGDARAATSAALAATANIFRISGAP
jgi:hypothetical protein